MDMHVDDREQAVERVIDLGGSRIEEHTVGEFSWTVMADPEGNEFCIAPHRISKRNLLTNGDPVLLFATMNRHFSLCVCACTCCAASPRG